MNRGRLRPAGKDNCVAMTGTLEPRAPWAGHGAVGAQLNTQEGFDVSYSTDPKHSQFNFCSNLLS